MSATRYCLYSEGTPMKFQQYDYLNKTCIMTTSVDMPVWMEELLTTDNRESVFFRDKLPNGANQSQTDAVG